MSFDDFKSKRLVSQQLKIDAQQALIDELVDALEGILIYEGDDSKCRYMIEPLIAKAKAERKGGE